MFGFGGGVTLGYSNGQFALTVNAGAGLDGGLQVDPRASENGRMSPSASNQAPAMAGITMAGYTKGGVEAKTPFGSAAAGMKVGGGKDLATGQNVGGKSTELGLSPTGEKLGLAASVQGGIEVSIYVRPREVANKIGEKIMQVLKPVAKEIEKSAITPQLQ